MPGSHPHSSGSAFAASGQGDLPFTSIRNDIIADTWDLLRKGFTHKKSKSYLFVRFLVILQGRQLLSKWRNPHETWPKSRRHAALVYRGYHCAVPVPDDERQPLGRLDLEMWAHPTQAVPGGLPTTAPPEGIRSNTVLTSFAGAKRTEVALKKNIKLGFGDPVTYVRDFGSVIPARPPLGAARPDGEAKVRNRRHQLIRASEPKSVSPRR